MADIELVIKISEDIWALMNPFRQMTEIEHAIALGTPLPKGHGRLGDLDAFEKLCTEHNIANSAYDNSPMIEQGNYSDGDCIWKPLFDFAPTIIEADPESEDKE